jgi:hypothetical protein
MNTENTMLVENNFCNARRRAQWSKVRSVLTGRRDDLPSFDEMKNGVRLEGESYIGCRSVQVERIVGSEGRSSDFNRVFCPRREFMRYRWASVDAAYYESVTLPPVQLLELDGKYFVRDGNHRVSVAKHHKQIFIDAEVTRLTSSRDLGSDSAREASVSQAAVESEAAA